MPENSDWVEATHNMNEFIDKEQNFIKNMSSLKAQLNIALGKEKNSPSNVKPIFGNDKRINSKNVTEYIEKIKLLEKAYEQLPLIPKDTSSQQKALAINAYMTSPAFVSYKNIMIDLIKSQKKVDEKLSVNYKDANDNSYNPFGALTILPTQHLPRYSLQLATLDKNKPKSNDPLDQEALQSIKQSLTVGQEIGAEVNTLRALTETQSNRADTDNKKETAAKARTAGLRLLVSLNLNNPIEIKGAYDFNKILTNINPNFFPLDGHNQLKDRGNGNVKLQAICDALGINANEKRFKFEPAKFDVVALDKLYKDDFSEKEYNSVSNPLWLVLKTAKPIDKNFTAEDKMKAYIELGQSLRYRGISNTNKYIEVLNLAKAAAEIVKIYPETATQFNSAFAHVADKDNLASWLAKKLSTEEKTLNKELFAQKGQRAPMPEIELPSVTLVEASLSQHKDSTATTVVDNVPEYSNSQASRKDEPDMNIETPNSSQVDEPQTEPTVANGIETPDVNTQDAKPLTEPVVVPIATPTTSEAESNQVLNSQKDLLAADPARPVIMQPIEKPKAQASELPLESIAPTQPKPMENSTPEENPINKTQPAIAPVTTAPIRVAPAVGKKPPAAEYRALIAEINAKATIELLNDFFKQFDGTNSTGIKKIIATIDNEMHGQHSATQQLNIINSTLKEVSQKLVDNEWSKSTKLFGLFQGRTKGAQAVYDFFSKPEKILARPQDLYELKATCAPLVLVHGKDPEKTDNQSMRR